MRIHPLLSELASLGRCQDAAHSCTGRPGHPGAGTPPASQLTIELTYDATGAHLGWFARVVEKAGCMSQGDIIAEALAMIADALDAWDDAGQEVARA